MVFLFLIPSIPATLGNFLIPPMIGAKDLAFPKLNLLSWYLYIIGGSMTLYAVITGGVDTGWTFYTPFSTTYSNGYVIADRHRHLCRRFFVDPYRTEFHRHHPSDARSGHDMVPPAAVRLVALRNQPDSGARHPGSRCDSSAARRSNAACTSAFSIPRLGGDPVLFQHLFWFYSHPAVYIMILPAMGVISEVISTFSRKRTVRIQLHRVFKRRDRGFRIYRLGPSFICQQPVGLRGYGVFRPELSGRDSFRDQGL